MKVEFLHSTPLHIVSSAIRECYDSHSGSDSGYNHGSERIETGAKDKALIHKVGNINKHASTLEHLVFSIRIEGVTRLLLQEFARHRIASLSVKSTRFTLQELENEQSMTGDMRKNIASDYIVFPPRKKFATEDEYVLFCDAQIAQLEMLREAIASGVKRDVAKYLVPDCYKTNISWTINARSLQNFLYLRSAKNAHFEIQELAHLVFNEMPKEYRYLFAESMNV